uniref:Coiled-coil domain containing 106a n=1 Tax=Maylandia zebra TaxID=106582 RepID=A0A3P9AX36_9CICH
MQKYGDRDSSSNPAPTATALLNKEREKLTFLKEKLEWQKKRIEELEGERDFLRSQLSSLTSMKLDLFHEHCFYFTLSEISSRSQSRRPGFKSRLWQHFFHLTFALFSFLVQTPNDIVQRYKSLLKTFPKTKTMTKAFQKHGLDRNTVVSTSSVGELAIAVPNVYQELLSNRPSGETVLAFAKRCEAAIQGSDEVKNKIESMKAAGTLLPIQRGKSV